MHAHQAGNFFGSVNIAAPPRLVAGYRAEDAAPPRPIEGEFFYAAPNGNDANNSCRDPTAPCTPQGAHDQAKVDYDLVRGGCRINLAPGTYTVPAGGTLISGSGILAGYFSCEVSEPDGREWLLPQ